MSKTLLDLSPTEFENLIFDLVRIKGAQNVSWRTPGTDGGRDIESYIYDTDFSGMVHSKKWYIECKRYKSSVNWPTIYSKVTYAISNDADYLLMCSTSKFTPTALNEVEKHNKLHSKPIIRLWSEQNIRQFLDENPELAYKYGFLIKDNLPGENFLELMLTLSKSIISTYSKRIFDEEPIDTNLMLAQSISEFVSVRVEDITMTQAIRESFNWTRENLLDICLDCSNQIRIDEDLQGGRVDFFGLKLIIIVLLFFKVTNFNVNNLLEGYAFSFSESDYLNIKNIFINKQSNLFMAISFWSNLNITVNDSDLLFLIEKR